MDSDSDQMMHLLLLVELELEHELRSDDVPSAASSSIRTELTSFGACHHIRMTRVGFTPALRMTGFRGQSWSVEDVKLAEAILGHSHRPVIDSSTVAWPLSCGQSRSLAKTVVRVTS